MQKTLGLFMLLFGLSVTEVEAQRPEARVQVRRVAGGTMLVRDITGDYSQHPKVFAELMRVRDAGYQSIGDCFGIYPTDPDSVESTATLKWQIGVRVESRTGAGLRKPAAPYRLEQLPTIEAAIIDTNVKDAALDGLAMLRWLPESGYVQSGPTRMEYLTHEGNLMLIPARIIVPIKKRRSGIVLPPAQSLIPDAATVSKPSAIQHEKLLVFVSDIQRADYEANLEQLRRHYDTIPISGYPPLVEARLRYWKGFAMWRRAINGFNESVAMVVQSLSAFTISSSNSEFGT